ncbi:MAG TPA: hypothetical protein VKT77_18385 [Chthonomonadaceae bacterium]|nr:hypothetical protein [Chthonomonadaceae bacterium]
MSRKKPVQAAPGSLGRSAVQPPKPPVVTRRADLVQAEVQFAQATRNGDIRTALRAANALIRMDPASAERHYNMALLFQHESRIELAVYEFMHAIMLEPNGPCSESARCFLEELDVMQLNQIALLAKEDLVFRMKLDRDCRAAAVERGFALSPMGEQLLCEFCEGPLADSPPPRPALYQ